LGVSLMLRGWDLAGFVDTYSYTAKVTSDYKLLFPDIFSMNGLIMASEFWYGLILFIISVFYIAKTFLSDNKINLRRYAFWLAIALVPLIEAWTKLASPYHFAQCIPGFVGFIALTWKHLSFNESKIIQRYSMIFIYVLCLLGMQSKLYLIYNNYHDGRTLENAYNQLWFNSYRDDPQTIQTSNYLIAADAIRQLSNKDSTLALGGGGSTSLYPLTNLLPPTFKFFALRALYASFEFNEEQLVSHLKEYRPTLIMPTVQSIWGMERLSKAVERTDLYELVAIIEHNQNLHAASIAGNIYRLKTFVKEGN